MCPHDCAGALVHHPRCVWKPAVKRWTLLETSTSLMGMENTAATPAGFRVIDTDPHGNVRILASGLSLAAAVLYRDSIVEFGGFHHALAIQPMPGTGPTWVPCSADTCGHDMHQTTGANGDREGWAEDPQADPVDNILDRQEAWAAVDNGVQT